MKNYYLDKLYDETVYAPSRKQKNQAQLQASLRAYTLEQMSKIAQGTSAINYDYLTDPTARKIFHKDYGFEPQAGIVANEQIETSPQRRLQIMLKNGDIKNHSEYVKKMDKLTDKDRHKEKWNKLAEAVEKQEVNRMAKTLESTIEELITTRSYRFNRHSVETHTQWAQSCLAEKGCYIKDIEFEKERHLTHGDNNSTNMRDLDSLWIENETKMVFPAIMITAETEQGATFFVQITDKYKSATEFESGKHPDYKISGNDKIQDITNIISNAVQTVKDNYQEKNNQQGEEFTR